MRSAFVEEHRHVIPVTRLCGIRDVTPRGFRAWRSRPASRRHHTDMVWLGHIRDRFRLSLGRCGRPRMTEEPKDLGVAVGHRRVGRLMRQNSITVKRNRTFRVTTDSNHSFNIAPNLLNRDVHADRRNRKWAGDIRSVRTREGWLGLAVLLDRQSRRVIGWAASNRMKRDLAIRALKMAVAAQGLHPPHRPWQPILLSRPPENPAPAWLPGVDEWDWALL